MLILMHLLPLVAPEHSTEWCDARLANLRALVEGGRFAQATALSTALRRDATPLPAFCLRDEPYTGSAHLFLLSNDLLRARLLDDPQRAADQYEVLGEDTWSLVTAGHVAVRGFTLDGRFVLSWHEHVYPGQAQRDDDDATARRGAARIAGGYTTGTKSILLLPVCPGDFTASQCNSAFDTGLVSSTYGGSITSYLRAVVDEAAPFLAENSRGQFRLVPTVPNPIRVPGYLSGTCGDVEYVGWTSWAPANPGVDSWAFAQLLAERGIARADFDFGGIVVPKCPYIGWSGRGWIGIPGFALNLSPNSLNPSFAHELGHNLGLHHGARVKAGQRGRAIWETGFVDTNTRPPYGGLMEYGSELTILGAGPFPRAHFTLPAKIVLEWASEADTVHVSASATCSPCGPYLLKPIDAPTLSAGPNVGIRIGSQLAERYFYIEHRTRIAPSGSAAMISSASLRLNAANGGVVSKTIMVDKLLSGSAGDGTILPGETVELDLGLEGSPSPMWVDVLGVQGGLLKVRLRTTATAATAVQAPLPSPPPPPSPSPPPPPMLCSVMRATLTNVRALNEWCNTDPARRNANDCPMFYADLNGGAKRCAFDAAQGKCLLDAVCTPDPPSPPPPMPPGTMLCSEMVATLTDVRAFGEWCNSDPARRYPDVCPNFYATTYSGPQRCKFLPDIRECRLDNLPCFDGRSGATPTVLRSCTTHVQRLGPIAAQPATILHPTAEACESTGFEVVGSAGSAADCTRTLSSVLLHFKLPSNISGDAIDSVALGFYLAATAGNSSGIRLDGLGTRAAEESLALSEMGPDDFYAGADDPTDAHAGVTQIDPSILKGSSAAAMVAYQSAALTQYVRAVLDRGGAGRHLVLRLAPSDWQGCDATACEGCGLGRHVITRSSETLSLYGRLSASGTEGKTPTAVPVDAAALTELWSDQLVELAQQDEAHKRTGGTTPSVSALAGIVGGCCALLLLGAAICLARSMPHPSLRVAIRRSTPKPLSSVSTKPSSGGSTSLMYSSRSSSLHSAPSTSIVQ